MYLDSFRQPRDRGEFEGRRHGGEQQLVRHDVGFEDSPVHKLLSNVLEKKYLRMSLPSRGTL